MVRAMIVILLLVFSLWFPGAARAQDITSNLVGHWKLDESSGTSAADSAGSNTGTLTNGPVWAMGQVNGALDFDGNNDYVNLGNNLSILQNVSAATLSAWVKVDTLGGVEQEIIAVSNNVAGSSSRASIYIEDTNQVVCGGRSADADAFQYVTVVATVSTNTWYHIACTINYTADSVKIYINSVEQGTTGTINFSQATTANTASARNAIGVEDDGSSYFLNGLIDDVRIYSRALTAADVEALYTAGLSDCSNPSGATGGISYNADWRTPQYCNGSIWMDMGNKKYVPTAVTFDGTNDYLTRGADLTGNADGKTATGSFWFRRNGGTGTAQAIWSNTSARFQISFNTGNQIRLLGTTTAGTTTLDIRGGTAITDTNWHHAMFSFDMADTAKRFIYIDGAAETITATTYNDNNVDFTRAEQAMGATTTGGSKLNADIAEFWFNSGTYVDLSAAANRRKFYRNAPVWLGDDGSLPTGTAPKVFLLGNTSSWHTNDGTGGGFTVNGGLAPITGPAGIVDLTTALDIWWKLDESSGTETSDASGNGFNGTLTNGPTWQSTGGKYDGGIELDGTDDYVETNLGGFNYSATGRKTTVAAWVYPQTLGGVVWWNGGGVGSIEGMNFEINADGSLSGGSYDNFGNSRDATTTAASLVPANQWSHVVMTYDATTSPDTIAIYVNGVSKAVTLTSGWTSGNPNLATWLDNMRIGDCTDSTYGPTNDCNGEYFDGIMDDVRVYSRLLSAADIAALYDNSRPCASPAGEAGKIIYNADADAMQYCDGADWKAMGPVPGAGGSGCTNPTRGKGIMVYNTAAKVMQYCDGADWIQVGKKFVAPASGLVAHWKFDESSGTSAADSTGNGHTGTLTNGPVWKPTGGKVDGALEFDDGGSTYVSLSTFDLGTTYTVSTWVKSYNPFGYNDDTVLAETADGSFWIGDSVGHGAKWNDAVSVTHGITTTNIFRHFVFVRQGTAITFYVDGAKVGSTQNVGDGTAPFLLTSIGDQGSTTLNGLMDDVRIYNRALAADEIQSLYYATGGQ